MAESDWLSVQRNKTTGQYRTKQGGSGGASSLADLNDTNITNPSDGNTLKYNSTSQKWENKEDSLANLSDVSMLSFSDKQVLSYNIRTQKWENAVLPDSYHVYSTTEQVVGEWIDGKPVYERIIRDARSGGFPEGEYEIYSGASTYHLLPDGLMGMLSNSAGSCYLVPWASTGSTAASTNSTSLWKNSSGKIKLAIRNDGYGSYALEVKLRYTKTTD